MILWIKKVWKLRINKTQKTKETLKIYANINKNKCFLVEIKKIYTYDEDTLTTAEVYKNIMSKKSSTIAGYKFTIKSNGINTTRCY